MGEALENGEQLIVNSTLCDFNALWPWVLRRRAFLLRRHRLSFSHSSKVEPVDLGFQEKKSLLVKCAVGSRKPQLTSIAYSLEGVT